MEAVAGFVIMYAAFFAVHRGTRYAADVFRRIYQSKLDKLKGWSANNLSTPASAGVRVGVRVGVKVGAGLGTALTGSVRAGRGFGAGVRSGWSDGRAIGVAKRRLALASRTPKGTPRSSPVPPRAPTTTASRSRARNPGKLVPYIGIGPPNGHVPHGTDAHGTGAHPSGGTKAQGWSRPRLSNETSGDAHRNLGEVPNGDQSPADPATPDAPADCGTTQTDTTEERHPMSSTVTGGEVSTMESLIPELRGIATEATAEMEDAQAARKRAAEDLQMIENMHASLQAQDLDSATLTGVAGMRESYTLRQRAAEQRAQAADALVSQAQDLVKGVQDRHGLMNEAYSSTPHPAKEGFYKN